MALRVSGGAFACVGVAALLASAGLASQPVETPADIQPDPAAQESREADLIAFGAEVFDMCDGCHSVEPGGPSAAGPNLHGVVGRKAGSLEGYLYTQALSSSGVIWDAASLDAYLADPDALVPGTDMRRGTVREPELREALIAFLADQSAPVTPAE